MPVQDGSTVQPTPTPETQAPTVSPLFAMGTLGPRLSRSWMIAIGVLTSLIMALIVFILLCSRAFSLSDNTFFFATVSPRAANALLSQEQIATLPVRWQQALGTNSRWPIVFGLTTIASVDQSNPDKHIRAFTLGPRWAIPKANNELQTHGLIRQSGALSSSSASEDSGTRYRSIFFHYVFSTGSFQGWMNPASIFPHASSSTRLTFHVADRKLVVSDVSIASKPENKQAEPSEPLFKPRSADLGLHLAALEPDIDTLELLAELPLDPIQTTLTSFDHAPDSLEANFTSSTLKAVRLVFQAPLRASQQATLLSLLDNNPKRHVFSLPDGTLAVEQLARLETNLTSSTDSTSPNEINWQAEDNSPLAEISGCAKGIWIARFSPVLLRRLLPSTSDFSAWLPAKGLQIWRTQQSLSVCHED